MSISHPVWPAALHDPFSFGSFSFGFAEKNRASNPAPRMCPVQFDGPPVTPTIPRAAAARWPLLLLREAPAFTSYIYIYCVHKRTGGPWTHYPWTDGC